MGRCILWNTQIKVVHMVGLYRTNVRLHKYWEVILGHTHCMKGFSECGIAYDFSLCTCVCMNCLISLAWALNICASQTWLLTCHCVHMLWTTICNHQIINFGVNSTPGLTFLLYMLPGRPHQHKRQVNIEKNVFRERLQAFYILDFRRAKEGR